MHGMMMCAMFNDGFHPRRINMPMSLMLGIGLQKHICAAENKKSSKPRTNFLKSRLRTMLF